MKIKNLKITPALLAIALASSIGSCVFNHQATEPVAFDIPESNPALEQLIHPTEEAAESAQFDITNSSQALQYINKDDGEQPTSIIDDIMEEVYESTPDVKIGFSK